MKNLLFLLLWPVMICQVSGQNIRLSKTQALADLDTMISTIHEVHPDMFSHCPEKKFFKRVEKIKATLPDTLSALQFYIQAAPLIGMLGDGHTSIHFSDFSLAFRDTAQRFFPLDIKISDNNALLYVKRDLTGQQLIPEGAQILSVNSRSHKEIMKNILQYCSGEKLFFKVQHLSNYLLFISYMNQLYPEQNFDIVYTYQGKRTKVHLPGISVFQLQKTMLQPQNSQPIPYAFSIDKEKNLAVMEFNSFSNREQFNYFADSMFCALKNENIGNLIIDIRNNSGGNSSIGDKLFQYISPCPFRQYGQITVRTTPTTLRLIKNCYGQEPANKEYGMFTTSVQELIPLAENPLRYTGNVYLLTSHSTFSSASSFSWAFKYFKMGPVIGEETGGIAYCFGDVLGFSLPHSRLQVGVSYKIFTHYGATPKDIHGTYPDYEIPAEQALDWTIDKLILKK